MSGAQAAAIATACCCSASQDGGGGNPDDCDPTSPGAESDRATTALSVSLDLSATEFAKVNALQGQQSQFSPPGQNCVIWNGSSCENEYPNGSAYSPYICDGDPARTRPTFPQCDYRGAHSRTCYNQTGNSNHMPNFVVPGTQCTCNSQGGCTGCTGSSYTTGGGTAIVLQTSTGARSWRTYQQSDTLIPQHQVGQWDWRARIIDTRQYGVNGTIFTVRLFCPPPVGVQYGSNANGGSGPQVEADPAGRFVDVRYSVEPNPAISYPFTFSRWGNADVGAIYVVADVQIDYRESYANLGSGWLAKVSLHHVVREQHLDLRHRFTMLMQPGQVARWHMQSAVPPEQGFMPITPSIQSRLSSTSPWLLWKPCLGANDTARGIYEPIGPAQYADDPSVRDYYQLPYVNCVLAGEYRGDGELRRIVVT